MGLIQRGASQADHRTGNRCGPVFLRYQCGEVDQDRYFPNLDLPVIYISHPYGGFTPNQMEAYFGKQYVNLLLYVSGVKSIETRNITGLTLLNLPFTGH